MSGARYLQQGNDLLPLPTPNHATVGIHTKNRSAFIGTLEEWAGVEGYTFEPHASGTSAWVAVKDAEGVEVATIYGSDIGDQAKFPDLTTVTLAAVQSILDEVRS